MRFAARESAIFGQFELAFGRDPRRGRRPAPHAPHGPRPGARGHAERRGLRRGAGRTLRLDQPSMPADALGDSSSSLAAGSPAFGRRARLGQGRVTRSGRAQAGFRRGSALFGDGVGQRPFVLSPDRRLMKPVWKDLETLGWISARTSSSGQPGGCVHGCLTRTPPVTPQRSPTTPQRHCPSRRRASTSPTGASGTGASCRC